MSVGGGWSGDRQVNAHIVSSTAVRSAIPPESQTPSRPVRQTAFGGVLGRGIGVEGLERITIRGERLALRRCKSRGAVLHNERTFVGCGGLAAVLVTRRRAGRRTRRRGRTRRVF